jgi:hypothetical protein
VLFPSKQEPDGHLKIGNTTGWLKKEMNVLGLTFDSRLDWDPQVPLEIKGANYFFCKGLRQSGSILNFRMTNTRRQTLLEVQNYLIYKFGKNIVSNHLSIWIYIV